LRRVNLVISLDSGTTHLAWGVQVPKIVSIFCCTPKTRYAPIGESDKYIALGNNGCKPCHKKKCPLKDGKNRCVNYPAVEEVFEAVHKLV
jgi:ADP-heptose:LPS heptosyltransferase